MPVNEENWVVGCFEIAELRGGLRVKVKAVETTAFRHETPNLASLVGDHYIQIGLMGSWRKTR
jgi:hypothetical protein